MLLSSWPGSVHQVCKLSWKLFRTLLQAFLPAELPRLAEWNRRKLPTSQADGYAYTLKSVHINSLFYKCFKSYVSYKGFYFHYKGYSSYYKLKSLVTLQTSQTLQRILVCNTNNILCNTRLGVRQLVSSRNRLSSLNFLACSSRSTQPCLGSYLTYACGAFGSVLRPLIQCLSGQHDIPFWMFFNRIRPTSRWRQINSGQHFLGD